MACFFGNIQDSVLDPSDFDPDPDPRIRTLITDPDPALFGCDFQDANKKCVFSKFFSAYLLLQVHLRKQFYEKKTYFWFRWWMSD